MKPPACQNPSASGSGKLCSSTHSPEQRLHSCRENWNRVSKSSGALQTARPAPTRQRHPSWSTLGARIGRNDSQRISQRTNSINCFWYDGSRRTPGPGTKKLIKIGNPSLQTCRIENSAALQKLEACGTTRQCSNQQLGVGLRLQSVWRTGNQRT